MPEANLPYGRQWISEIDIQAVNEVLRSDFLTTGPMVERFEAALVAYTGASFTKVVNSGTSALHAAYFAAGLERGDEIITSPLTFAATANAARYLGATVKFVDVQRDTGNLAPPLIEEAIGERTRLIVPVDYAGHPADYDEIREVADRHGLAVVADAAHSLGATYRGRSVGTLADATALSFHPVKPITTAEGGALLTDDEHLDERAGSFRTHGITRHLGPENVADGPWYYEMRELGFNYRLTDLQCALGLSQLGRLDKFLARRRQVAAMYDEVLAAHDALVLPGRRDYVESGWHLYVVRVAGHPKLRRPFFERLRELGLGVQVHYIPVPYHPYYRDLGYRPGAWPAAEDFYQRCLSLPLYPLMSDDDVHSSIERVERAIKEVL